MQFASFKTDDKIYVFRSELTPHFLSAANRGKLEEMFAMSDVVMDRSLGLFEKMRWMSPGDFFLDYFGVKYGKTE
jgi:hypothetical protein